jgi:hypothetical protein
MESFYCCIFMSNRFSFCKTLFGNKYIILSHCLFCIHFLHGMCVNLIPKHTYYEYSVWVLKPGMTEWYQSHVSCRNASLVRRVIFSRLFSNQNYFYPTFLKIYSRTRLCPLSYIFFNLYYSYGKWRKMQLQQWWQQWRLEPTLNTWAIVDCPSSTSLDHAANLGANARRQPTNVIYGSKTLIKEEK